MITQYPTTHLTDAQLRASPVCVSDVTWRAEEAGLVGSKIAHIYNIFGWRNQWNSTSVMGDCCAYLVGGQDNMSIPATGTTYYVNSTSAQDLTAGTGVDRIRIVYLDSSGNQQVTTANLNGTTAVSIGSGFSFIQWMESYHSVTFERVAAGDLTISSINGVATEATTMEMIRAGGNRSQSLRYKVPTGYRAHILDYDAEAAGTTMDIRLRATVFSDDASLSNAFHFIDVATLASSATHSSEMMYRKLPAGAIVKLSAIPTAKAAGNRLTGSMHILVIEN